MKKIYFIDGSLKGTISEVEDSSDQYYHCLSPNQQPNYYKEESTLIIDNDNNEQWYEEPFALSFNMETYSYHQITMPILNTVTVGKLRESNENVSLGKQIHLLYELFPNEFPVSNHITAEGAIPTSGIYNHVQQNNSLTWNLGIFRNDITNGTNSYPNLQSYFIEGNPEIEHQLEDLARNESLRREIYNLSSYYPDHEAFRQRMEALGITQDEQDFANSLNEIESQTNTEDNNGN